MRKAFTMCIVDRGCEFSPRCLNCPFPLCLADLPAPAHVGWIKLERPLSAGEICQLIQSDALRSTERDHRIILWKK